MQLKRVKKQPYSGFHWKNHPESLKIAVVVAHLGKTKRKVELFNTHDSPKPRLTSATRGSARCGATKITRID